MIWGLFWALYLGKLPFILADNESHGGIWGYIGLRVEGKHFGLGTQSSGCWVEG